MGPRSHQVSKRADKATVGEAARPNPSLRRARRSELRPPARDASARRRYFERDPKNALYRPALDGLVSHIDGLGRPEEVRQDCMVYGRNCWLLCTRLAPSPTAPYAMAVSAADEASIDDLIALLRDVTHNCWYGYYFFK